jgi:hypothetical protein
MNSKSLELRFSFFVFSTKALLAVQNQRIQNEYVNSFLSQCRIVKNLVITTCKLARLFTLINASLQNSVRNKMLTFKPAKFARYCKPERTCTSDRKRRINFIKNT